MFMDAALSFDRKSLTITSPPNNRIYPPGPGMTPLSAFSNSELNHLISLHFRDD